MILNVENLSHGFGDRAIFDNVSFRLLKGEHIGLVGANGEGKSTFMNIVTGKLMPDEGKVEWNKNVRTGYLDQHAVLEKGMTIGEILKSAFSYLFDMEDKMNEICDKMGSADENEMEVMMEELGTIQDLLTNHDFYIIDAKVEEVARALGLLELGLDKDVTELSGGQRTKVLLGKLLLEKPDILLLDEPTNYLDANHIEWLKRYLQEYEAGKIYLCSRTLAHAGNIQKEFQEIEIISYEQRYEIMKQCDIVVSATSAPHVVVKQEYYTPEKQVTFLDLATPRDIDPKLSDDSKVNLINLDTIKEISKANQSEREELCRQSNTMISKAKEETMQWLFQAPMEETIRSLQEKCTEIVEDSYSYLSRKIDFGTREQKLLKKVLNASLQRMIKEPIQELKHLETRQEQADYKKMVEQLFGIETKKGK